MSQRTRIYYTAEQKALMWERWKKGDTLHDIGRLFDRGHSSVQNILQEQEASNHGKESGQIYLLLLLNEK